MRETEKAPLPTTGIMAVIISLLIFKSAVVIFGDKKLAIC